MMKLMMKLTQKMMSTPTRYIKSFILDELLDDIALLNSSDFDH